MNITILGLQCRLELNEGWDVWIDHTEGEHPTLRYLLPGQSYRERIVCGARSKKSAIEIARRSIIGLPRNRPEEEKGT